MNSLADQAGLTRRPLSTWLEMVWKALPFLLPVLLLLPALSDFPYPSDEALFSDLTISHYPSAYYLRQSLLSGGALPLWSPAILSGYPFAANPLSGFWYPPGWLALVLPLPLAFNLLVLLHLAWGGAGFYRLLRLEGLQPAAAGFAGLAFTGMPKLFAHYGAGHVSLIYAVCWTPWLLLAVRSWIHRDDTGRLSRALSWALPAIIYAAILLADVRWAAYAGFLWWGYAAFLFWKLSRQSGGETLAGFGSGWVRFTLRLLGMLGLGISLAAPLVIPLAEYTRLSTRNNLSAADSLAYSLPPARLLGLLFPDYAGFHEWMLYPGWFVLAPGLLAIVWRSVRSRAGFWIVVTVVSLVFSLGQYLPGMPSLASLPVLDLLRVPARLLFINGMALAALAGYGLQALLEDFSDRQAAVGKLLLVGLVAFCGLVAVLVIGLIGWLPVGYAWGAVAGLISAGWIWLRLSGWLVHRQVWIAGLFFLCILDLGILDRSLFSPRPAETVLAEAGELAAYLGDQPGLFRVYSPSYSLPQQTAIHSGLELADGVDPLQLRAYADFMETASGVPQAGYSVTLPPFRGGEPATANSAYTPRPDLLGLLNVRFIAAQFDLSHPRLVLIRRFGETRLYENLDNLPRAWIQPETLPVGEGVHAVDPVDWSPDRIEIQVEGPGLLVLSEISYPGWQVWVDGQRQPLQTSATILRSVRLEPGMHKVVFVFRPAGVYAGLVLFLVGGVVIIAGSTLAARRRAV